MCEARVVDECAASSLSRVEIFIIYINVLHSIVIHAVNIQVVLGSLGGKVRN